MKTEMVLSCPNCGAENTVSMELESGRLNEFVSMMIPGIKQYSFHGKTKCACGETINAVLTVGTGKAQIFMQKENEL
jgi:primosomal protein N'